MTKSKGEENWEPLGSFDTEDEARREIDRRKAKPRADSDPTLSDYWSSLLEVGGDWETRQSRETCNLYDTCHATAIAPSSLGSMRLSEIRKIDCQRFVDRLYSTTYQTKNGKPKTYGTGTVRRYGSCLRQILGHAVEAGFLEANPADGLKYRKLLEASSYILTDEDLVHLPEQLEAYNPLLSAMVTVLADTGCRPGELCAMQAEKIDEDGIWQIDDTRKRKGGLKGATKTGRVRYVQLSDDAFAAVKAQGVTSGPIWLNSKGRPVNPGALNLMLRRWREAFGLPEINARNLRKTFVTRGVEMGQVKAVQSAVGHASAKTTLDVYAKSRRHAETDLIKKLTVSRPSLVHRGEDKGEAGHPEASRDAAERAGFELEVSGGD